MPAELHTRAEELADPIGDHTHSPTEGIVHRYPDRVLLKLTPLCAAYCRFCFRREMVGPQSGSMLSPEALDKAIDYIASNPKIWEVVLTGGDPLILSARRLKDVVARLAKIEHLAVIRVHTRPSSICCLACMVCTASWPQGNAIFHFRRLRHGK